MKLGQRALAILEALLAADGKIVSKAELMNAAWQSLNIEESNLSVQIAALRKLLGHNLQGGEWIVTAQRTGYHFLKSDDKALSAIPTSSAPPDAAALSIAVLPFTDAGGAPDGVYFAEGLAEDLITDLSKIDDLLVIARHSSFSFKGKEVTIGQIASSLGVRYVVEGNVRRVDGRVRINVQLIDSKVNNQIWAERFDRDLKDVFLIQEEVAGHVAQSIAGKISSEGMKRRRLPTSLEAYDLVLRSRDLSMQSALGCREALAKLKQAVQIDPDYAEAWRQLANAEMFSWMFWGEPEAQYRELALHHAKCAVELDPNDSEAHWVLAMILLYERDWDGAGANYVASIKLNPSDGGVRASMANYYVLTGQPLLALETGKLAMRLNPAPPGWYFWLIGQTQTVLGQYSEAIATLRQPKTYRTISRRILAAALALDGQDALAAEEAKFFMSSSPNWTIKKWAETQPFKFQSDIDFWKSAYLKAGLPE